MTTHVRAGVLVIGTTGSFSATRPMHVEISVPSLQALKLSGSGVISPANIHAQRLSVTPIATGAGGAVPGVQRLEFERVGCRGPASQVMVPIDQIAGTAEPRTCFDRRFRPTSEGPRARFEWLAAAVLSGRGMEPVELYHCGGRYYVLDGNHRIAVARALGERSVCANVTEVRLNKPGKPRSDSSVQAAGSSAMQ